LYEVVESAKQFKGGIFEVITDHVTMPDGSVAPRDCVYKRGAVAVVALTAAREVVLVRQYRHPTRQYLWEIPAGLLDVDGEDPPATALRELAEETDFTAGRLDHLFSLFTSPGFTNEMTHVYLAQDLHEVPEKERHQRQGEEADMQIKLVPLASALQMITNGEISNAVSVAALLAAKSRLT
jgi:ADP-ribose pyrophosphatase